MTIRRWQVAGILSLAFLVGVLYWFSRPGPSRQQLHGEAVFTRPVQITPGLQELLQVELSGQDWWKTEPKVTLGEEVTVSVKWIGKKSHQFHHLMYIAPRPEANPDFGFWDQRVDWYLGTSGKTKKRVVRLQPGKYVVRFFLQTLGGDPNIEPPPRVNLVAERPFTVLPPSDPNLVGVLPGDEERTRLKIIVSKQGPGLDLGEDHAK